MARRRRLSTGNAKRQVHLDMQVLKESLIEVLALKQAKMVRERPLCLRVGDREVIPDSLAPAALLSTAKEFGATVELKYPKAWKRLYRV